jgi:N-methylhydantoinase B
MLFDQRQVRPGVNGAGQHRSGGGNLVIFRPHGTDRLVGQMLGMRAYVPLEGAAGGLPGATTDLIIHRAGGTTERVSTAAAGVIVDAGESFEIRCASGGGVGDPLRRDPDDVAVDAGSGRLSPTEAAGVYGVVLRDDGSVDRPATSRRRSAIRRRRLRRSQPALKLVDETERPDPDGEPDVPLYPGVTRRGRAAVAVDSAAVLAIAPDHWTDGCPVLEERRPGPGPAIVTRAYLDPRTGYILHVEVLPEGVPRAFEVRPAEWA